MKDANGRTLGSIFNKHTNRATIEELKEQLLAKQPGFKVDHAVIWQADRAATVDRLPLAGSIYQDNENDQARQLNGFDAYVEQLEPVAGLYVLQGLGSRGLSLAPLLAEQLVAQFFGEPEPLAKPLQQVIHSARFSYRASKRKP